MYEFVLRTIYYLRFVITWHVDYFYFSSYRIQKKYTTSSVKPPMRGFQSLHYVVIVKTNFYQKQYHINMMGVSGRSSLSSLLESPFHPPIISINILIKKIQYYIYDEQNYSKNNVWKTFFLTTPPSLVIVMWYVLKIFKSLFSFSSLLIRLFYRSYYRNATDIKQVHRLNI